MPEDIHFTIIGVDLFEETTNKNIKELLSILNIPTFLEKDSMIIGNGVKNVFDKYHYFDSMILNLKITPLNTKIFKDLPKSANLIANDLIIMDITLAKKILNLNENESTDIILNVPQ